MATTTNYAFADTQTGVADCRPTAGCDPRPVCPACGGLECLCRPRFFAGQLLSEEDLNRLDHYIVAKNRLHNRHLFGTGVVCGLEVVCSTCDAGGNGNVVVRPGYALSPCGNDIVVCRDEKVNVCELINQCRPKSVDDCYQPGVDPDDCADADEDWVLTICYQEKPSRGVTAMRGASCGCGGSGGCGCGKATGTAAGSSAGYATDSGCGCGGGKSSARTANTRSAAKPGPVAPQCEPTLTCEGYSFAVYKLPPAGSDAAQKRNYGALVKRFLCCLEPLIKQMQTTPSDNATVSERYQWLVNLKAMVRDFLINEGLYDCDLAAKLSAVALPSAGGQTLQNYMPLWTASALAILAVVVAIFQKCMCAALLPPCPPAEMNDCVPIATVNVSRGHCRVRHVCNLTNRQYVMTFPAIQYWLSWLPFMSAWDEGQAFPALIAKFCCTPISEMFNFDDASALSFKSAQSSAAPLTGSTTQPLKKAGHPFSQLMAESLTGSAPRVNAATLLLSRVGARNPDGSPLVSEAAFEHPGEAMLIDQVLAPALAPLTELAGLAGLAGAFQPRAAGRSADEAGAVASLAEEVKTLKKSIERQGKELERLRKR